MPTATASYPERRLARGALALCALLAGAGAGCGGADGSAGDDAGADNGTCLLPANAHGPASAVALDGNTASGQLCVRGQQNWYSLTLPDGINLLDVSAGYPGALTRVAIVAQLFSADGQTAVANGDLSDPRTGVRKGAVSTTLKVPQAGKYLMVVRDGTGSASDTLNSYVLTVAFAADPDTHEPNDVPMQAHPADALPAWLAYRNDHDLYQVAVPANNLLLGVRLANPMASQKVLHYALKDSTAAIVAEGDTVPAPMAAEVNRLLPTAAAATYYLDVSCNDGSPPDRRPASGYTVALTAHPELDPNDQPTRNDRGVGATCLGPVGGDGSCGALYSGPRAGWHNKGQIGSLGDRDFFRFSVAPGTTPAIVEINATIGATPMQLAVDLLVPHAASPCTKDNECAAVNLPCKVDSDCEMSHSCLPASDYPFCAKGTQCRLCAGASACVPVDKASGATVCAIPQYLVHDKDGSHAVRTAQPLFGSGVVYVVVHDYQDDAFDYGNDYSIDVSAYPEPDPGDQSSNPKLRNNFYNPYPLQDDDLRPSMDRARDISAALTGGQTVTGYISYSSDEDWYTFKHPCPKMDCGLLWEFTQPGPSPMRAAFLMRRDDQGLHESWTYSGPTATDKLPGPVTATFGGGDCHECSFASARYNGAQYYLQVRAVGGQHFDASGRGQYGFRLKAVTAGCPANCSEAGAMCTCFCKALNMCPPGPQL